MLRRGKGAVGKYRSGKQRSFLDVKIKGGEKNGSVVKCLTGKQLEM